MAAGILFGKLRIIRTFFSERNIGIFVLDRARPPKATIVPWKKIRIS